MKILDKVKPLTWVVNTPYFMHTQIRQMIYKNSPSHYLEHVAPNKSTMLLLPGLGSTWSEIKNIGDKISMLGHPTYILPQLGRNLFDIETSSKIVEKFIEENDLHDLILIAHSKGGLIGKHVIANHDPKERIKKMIAIATPFQGAQIARLFKASRIKEVGPDSMTIKKLHKVRDVNKKIVSIYPKHDNYVIDNKSFHLEGGENFEVNLRGHAKILYSKETWDIIAKYI